MSQITIEVVSVGAVETVPTKNGKSYSTVEVAYKKDGKIEGKKIMSFTNPSVFKAVQDMVAGKTYTITTEKNDKGYWQWENVSYGEEHYPGEPTVTPKETKHIINYETREERQQRQQFIIRQSSITSAISLLAANGGKKNTVEETLEVAQKFVDFVNGNGTQKAAEFADFPDDIPL